MVHVHVREVSTIPNQQPTLRCLGMLNELPADGLTSSDHGKDFEAAFISYREIEGTTPDQCRDDWGWTTNL